MNWTKVLRILIVGYLIAYYKSHIYPYCKVEIYLSTAGRVPLICSRTRTGIVLRFSSMLIRLLKYQINDFWRIIHCKQCNRIVRRDVLWQVDLPAPIRQLHRRESVPLLAQWLCIRPEGSFIGRIENSVFRHYGGGAIE